MRLRSAQIALAAAAGKASIKVYRKPRVAILSTGDELVEVAEKPGQARSATATVIHWQRWWRNAAARAVQLPIAPDEEGKLTELIQEGLKADMLLLSGGVSMESSTSSSRHLIAWEQNSFSRSADPARKAGGLWGSRGSSVLRFAGESGVSDGYV